MFAAISGLKQHQTMLDVTANDIANVNTLGFKANRTTFKDPLSQLQRGGALRPPARAARTRLRSAWASAWRRSTRSWAAAPADDGQRARRRHPGRGLVPCRPGHRPAVPTTVEYTRAGNFSRNDQGYLVTQDGYYVIGKQATVAAGRPPSYAPGADSLINIPTGATNVRSRRTARSRTCRSAAAPA